jgi:DNA polymerase III epsilon subunit-like protein
MFYKMKILVFDTETTGLPEKRDTSILETNKWPHIVQMSWILYDVEKKTILNCQDHIINCPVDIPEESTKIHGITKACSMASGVDMRFVLDLFDVDIQIADIVVAHNISFDKRMCMVESIRLHRKQYFTRDGIKRPEYCTLKQTKEFCNIERVSSNGFQYIKYPTLVELHNKLFGFIPSGAHDSMADVLICLRCYLYFTQQIDIIQTDIQIDELYRRYCMKC